MVRAAAQQLAEAGVEAPRGDAWLLLAHAAGCDRTSLMASGHDPVPSDVADRFAALVERRARREPMAYIQGEREFWSLSFRVDPSVLVPRPDSETLIAAALRRRPDRQARLRLLDLGTGSGCLLLALLHELPAACGLGVDLSLPALAQARRNAERLGLAARSHFLCGSWGAGLASQFEIIMANPPYISSQDLPSLQPELAFEPRLALAAGADGLAAYRALLPDVARLLAPGGLALLELGAGQAAAVAELASAAGLAVAALEPDLAGIERCLVLQPDGR